VVLVKSRLHYQNHHRRVEETGGFCSTHTPRNVIFSPEVVFFSIGELEMQRLNEDTATRLHSFTQLSLAMCVGVAALQLWHLKTFFQKQHIL